MKRHLAEVKIINIRLTMKLLTAILILSMSNFRGGTTVTVQTLNSYTSRLDVCQCIVVHTRMDNMSENKTSTSMTQ